MDWWAGGLVEWIGGWVGLVEWCGLVDWWIDEGLQRVRGEAHAQVAISNVIV